ncbi:MAG: glutamate racemase [Granulosicoccaceae bacterium]
MSVLIFDSGVGGLSVLREARAVLSGHQFIYVGDEAGFPYGDWQEAPLLARILSLFESLMNHYSPDAVIVACNTASTLILPALRERYTTPFIGIVPAIKSAAERTASGLFSVLATPATITRQHTKELIQQFAGDCSVNLVGATCLARLAEDHMLGRKIDATVLKDEIAPCFVETPQGKTDIITLGCTHYPFLVNEMRKLAPWPVDWLDPAEAVARRALHQLQNSRAAPRVSNYSSDIAVMSSGLPDDARDRVFNSFGLVGRDKKITDKLILISSKQSLPKARS